jgi:parallel beta-helix repeat protein
MTRSRPLKLAALALLVLGLGLGTPVGLAQRTITVCPQGCQYAKIQEAINAASEGDTIQVKAGTYQENLQIIKRLTLQGEGKDKVTIQGTVTILSTKLVTLSGFTVKGGQGVYIEDSTTVVFSDNAFVESTAEGLRARSSSITLRGNLISRNKSHGLLLVLGSKALITGNTITSNGGDGVTIRASQADLSDNIVRDNGGCGVRADADSTVTGSVTSANFGGNQGGGLCEKAVKLDTEPPTGSLTINDGADSTTSTTVTLRITANDPLSGVAEMRFSNDGRTWSDWEGFQSTRSWDLTRFGGSSSFGLKTVYAQLRDRAGNVSQTFSATIRFTLPFTGTLTGHTWWVLSVAFSPDGRLLASGSCGQRNSIGGCIQGEIKLWDVASGSLVRTLTGHTGVVLSVAFSPDGRLLASGSCGQRNSIGGCIQGEIKLWDVASGSLVRTLTGHTGVVRSVAFSPDGRLLASGSYDDTIKLWEVASGREVRTLTGHTADVESVAFSPDGRLLASGSDDETIKLWEVASGSLVRTLTGHTDYVRSVAFSPDGRLLASGSDDKTIKLWDVATGRLVLTLIGHTDWVRSVAFSPDGRLLASGSDDDTIKLWDVATGRLVLTLIGHTDWVRSVAFSPDGRLLASGSADKTIRLWDISDLVGR